MGALCAMPKWLEGRPTFARLPRSAKTSWRSPSLLGAPLSTPSLTSAAQSLCWSARQVSAHFLHGRFFPTDQRNIISPEQVGIGNTTIAAALLAALTGRDPEECSGKGTGLDDEGVARKVSAVREGLALHAEAVSSRDPMRILGALGGFEIAAMTGAFLQASSRGVVALVDGYMSSVAALFAVRLEPKCRDAMLFTSVSAERGALLVAEALGGVR